jgi:hypothetical protein
MGRFFAKLQQTRSFGAVIVRPQKSWIEVASFERRNVGEINDGVER